MICNKCGTENNENSKFCNNCGTSFDSSTEEKSLELVNNKSKRKTIKNIIFTIVAIALVGVLVLLSNIFIQKYNEYVIDKNIKNGNYIVAYEKSEEPQKESIYKENLVAFLCKDIKNSFKDPESFELVGSWYCKNYYAEDHPNGPDGPYIVLSVRGKNGFGGYGLEYYLFKKSEKSQDFEYINSFQDLDWESGINRMKKYGTSIFTEQEIEEMIEEGNQKLRVVNISAKKEMLDTESVNNINNISKQGLLKDVEKITINDAQYDF